MKTYSLKQLIRFMQRNLKNKVDYGNPVIAGKYPSCLMCQFYRSKGENVRRVSADGDLCFEDFSAFPIAKMDESFNIVKLNEVHAGAETIRDIYENMKEKDII